MSGAAEGNALEEIAQVEALIETKMSELAMIRSMRADLKGKLPPIGTIPLPVYRSKKARIDSLGLKEQILVAELPTLRRRRKDLTTVRRPQHPGQAILDSSPEPCLFSRMFVKTAEELLDPSLFEELRRIVFLRVQSGDKGRSSRPGDAQSFANAQFVR